MAKNLLLGSKEDVRQAIRRRSAEIASKMTDKEFFLCPQFRKYATQLADFILRKHRLYSLDLQYDESDSAPVAYTDGKMIYLNTGNPLARFPKRLERRFKTNMGALFHECAHKLFMDFKLHNKVLDQILSGTLYGNFETNGDPDLEKALEELRKVTASPYAKAIAQIYQDLANRIGDGHDEARMKQRFPGFIRECIETVGEVQMEMAPTLREMIDKRASTYSILNSLILFYAKFGHYEVGEENEDTEKIVSLMVSMETVIDLAVEEDDCNKRYDHLNLLLLYLWPFLREKFPEDPNSSSGDGDPSDGSGGAGGGSGGSGDSSSSSSGSSGSDPDGSSGSGGGAQMSAEDLAEALRQAAEEASKSMGANPMPANCSDAAVDPSQVSSDGMDPGSDTDASDIANAAAQSQATTEVQKQMDQAQKEALRKLKVPLIHRDVELHLYRHNPTDETLYKEIKREVDPIVRNLVNAMRAVLRDMNDEFIEKHRINGPIVDVTSAYRQDKRFFSKKKLPDDQPDMALCILIDQSGSMYGENLDHARKTAILLERFASELEIPVMIAGHNTGDNSCRLMIYNDFVSALTDKDRYSIAGMRASGANRDGFAIRVCAELLARRPEQVKMMVVISDGSPADTGYYGEEAMQDVTDTVREFRRKGMLIYGAAIDDDRDVIEEIYGKNFLSINNLSSMPKTMVRLIKSQIN